MRALFYGRLSASELPRSDPHGRRGPDSTCAWPASATPISSSLPGTWTSGACSATSSSAKSWMRPTSAWIGQRVVGDINAACSRLPDVPARAGIRTARTAPRWASRSRRLLQRLRSCCPQANLYRVPDSVSDETAVFTEPLAAACEILEQVHVAPTDRVVVLGDGKLGSAGAVRLAADRRRSAAGGPASREAGTGSRLGRSDPTGRRARRGPSPEHYAADLVVECTGNADGLCACTLIFAQPRQVNPQEYLPFEYPSGDSCV